MTTTAIPSLSVDDFKLNVQDFDRMANGTGTYTDRFGDERLTLDEFMRRNSYEVPVAFASGIAVSRTTQTVTYNGDTYHAAPSAIPFTTTGTFNSAQWLLLRQNLEPQGIVLANKVITGFDATGLQNNAWVHFAGRDTVGDGGGGYLRFLAGSTTPPIGDLVYAVPGGRLIRDLYRSAFISYQPPGVGSNLRNVQDKLAELRSSGDYPGWGSRCFGAGTNVLGNAGFVGVENIAFGDNVLPAITTGYANVGVGIDVLTVNTTGAFNYAFGVKCLHRNTSGMDNAAFGTYTLYNNTTGGSNCAFGQDGQRYGETGSYNVTTGVQALYNNVTGSYNSAFGNYAARGTANPPDEGAGTGPSPTFLCAFGSSAVYNAAGTYNHGFGVETLYNVTGSYNTAAGGLAGRAITSGAYNVVIGYNAGNTGQTATASGSVAVGKDARTTGDDGIALGSGASAAQNAVAIGANVTAPNPNQVVIGNSGNTGNFFYGGLQPQLDNAHPIGGASARWSVVYAGTGTINTSDERSKQDAEPIPQAWLDAWGDVEFVRYKFRDAVAAKGDGARWHVGVIAQRVKDAFEARGIDPFEIGILCYDAWEEQVGASGEIHPAGDRYGIRYEEALALECAYLRSKLEVKQ